MYIVFLAAQDSMPEYSVVEKEARISRALADAKTSTGDDTAHHHQPMPEYAAVNKPRKPPASPDVKANVNGVNDNQSDDTGVSSPRRCATSSRAPCRATGTDDHVTRPRSDLDIIAMTENDVYERGDAEAAASDVYSLEQPLTTVADDGIDPETIQMTENDVYES